MINRKQKVVLNGHSSERLSLYAGVPQGSVLVPILFLIYKNDISDYLTSEAFFFADHALFHKIREYSVLLSVMVRILTGGYQYVS